MSAASSDQIIIELATALGKERALTDQESRWQEAALRRFDRANGRVRPWGPGKPLWLSKDDAALKRLLRRNKTYREIGRAMGKSEHAIKSRVRQLKRMGKFVSPKERPLAAAQAEA